MKKLITYINLFINLKNKNSKYFLNYKNKKTKLFLFLIKYGFKPKGNILKFKYLLGLISLQLSTVLSTILLKMDEVY